MNKNLRFIFWGLILVFFDFHIGVIEMLPNFIGYILIWKGVDKLKKHDVEFGKSVIYVQIMVGISIMQLGMSLFGLDGSVITMSNIWIIVLEEVGLLITLIIIYYIFKGLYNLEEARVNAQLYNKVRFRWRFYFYSTISAIILESFLLNYEVTFTLLPIAYFFYFIAEVLILLMVRKEGKEFVTLV
ncbi:hypothetical protein [Clostridium sp.]|uniref:hypothetical protein n=1 Tax=Clostridium sp. TaxID=1506 RepID=UPI003217602F